MHRRAFAQLAAAARGGKIDVRGSIGAGPTKSRIPGRGPVRYKKDVALLLVTIGGVKCKIDLHKNR